MASAIFIKNNKFVQKLDSDLEVTKFLRKRNIRIADQIIEIKIVQKVSFLHRLMRLPFSVIIHHVLHSYIILIIEIKTMRL